MKNLSGQSLKGYKIYERIGAGSDSVVYRALHLNIGRDVALKIISPRIASQADFIRRFEIEVQRIARLEHLHIVPLYDFWRDPSGAYLVMRRMQAGSLAQSLLKGRLDLSAAAHLLDQMASGLAAAHTQQIVHGGLKPANILLDEEGNAYLSDFGITNELFMQPSPLRLQEIPAGTRLYLPPERRRGEELTPKSDQYSLGVTLYQALAGYGIEHILDFNESLPAIKTINPAVSAGVYTVIQKATAQEPNERYPDVLEMAAAFRTAAGLEEHSSLSLLVEILTSREMEILAYIVEGHSNKQIASTLYIELGTVKWHITQLYSKMGVRSRRQAIIRARELNLLQPREEADGVEAASHASTGVALLAPVNPYKGLRAFNTADSRDFFGREAFVEQLLDRLRDADQVSRFLAVLGPSGGGKSSLINAGLIPAIRAGKLPGAERWFVVQMTPGARPLDELEASLTRIAVEQPGDLHAQLTGDAGGLIRAVKLVLPDDGSHLFLVIDQFEELFVLTEDGAARELFLRLIYEAVSQPSSRVHVIIAMRADFYDRPLHHPGFGELVLNRMETLLPLSADALERAIVEPAMQAGVKLEQGLPARIIEDILYQPGALPLLQYALTELFESQEERVMSHRAYEDIGGAVGALALRADEVYLGFGDAGRVAARQMFLRMVSLNESSVDGARWSDTRRRIPRDELLALAEDPELMDEVIDTFAAYRLLTLDHDSSTRQPIVELAHEALLSEWRRLETWLSESRDDLLLYSRFQALALEWDKNNQDSGYLLREARLDQFAGWAETTDLALTPTEQVFLETSIHAREFRRQVEEQRRKRELATAQKLVETESLRVEEQARANRILRWLAVGLAVLLLAAIGAALYAGEEGRRAVKQAQIAFARELASEALGNLAGDPDLSIHLALQAVLVTQEQDGFVLPVAEEALHRAIQASRVIFTVPQSGGVAFSPDGLNLVIGGADGSIGIWDVQTGELLGSLEGHTQAVTSIAFSPDGRLLASASTDHHRTVWDFSTGKQVLNLPGPDNPTFTAGLSKVVFSPDGKYLLSSAQFEEAAIWDLASNQEVIHFDDSAGPSADFSPDGGKLALMTAVWDISRSLESIAESVEQADNPLVLSWQERLFDYADPLIEFRAPSSDIESAFHEPGSVSYSPDGKRLLTTVISSLAVMREAATGEPLFYLSDHAGIINHTAFSPKGKQIATASADRTARVWDADSGQILLVLQGHNDEVFQVAFSPDGEYLATSSLDGTTKIWDLTMEGSGEWLSPTAHRGAVLLAFDPQNPYLVTVGEGDRVDNLDLRTGKSVFTLDGSQYTFSTISFSPDGVLLALSDREGSVHLFDTANGDHLRTIRLGRIVSALSFSPDSQLLYLGSEEGVLSLLDLHTGEMINEWVVQDGFVNGVALSPDGKNLAIAGADGKLIVYDLNIILSTPPTNDPPKGIGQLPDQATLMSMIGHTDLIFYLDISPDGTKYLTASFDGTAKVWDAATGKLLLTLAGHRGRVWRAEFHPDGRRIATAGADGALILWDAMTGEQLFVLSHWPGAINDLAFSDDGNFLAASGADGAVRMYVMPVEELIELAKARLTRQMTEEECKRYLHVNRCP